MTCPNCGSAKLVHDTRDLPYTYQGETTTMPAVTGDWCPACDEAVLAMDESQRVSQAMLEFNKQVNVAAGFRQARKAGRLQPGDPQDKKAR
ncbi:MAG TPA: type II toxin-antitoxin system MqsA family antitoxin [Moraxellaceae bacterium]|nr:type II toxin-antitoxin system MqsA family antitoxin [Moraxellaceae bacterium]